MFRNAPDAYYYLDKKKPDMFKLMCNLLKYGRLTNIASALVQNLDYEGMKWSDLPSRIKYAQEAYRDIINLVQLNITSDGNFSGVDRYLKTIDEFMPKNVRISRITLVAADRIEWRINPRHSVLFYNHRQTSLESMYDMIWDNTKNNFAHLPNLIVQSNCLNLYSFITYLRKKVRLTHVCAMHCVPYREVIRFDREKYAKLEKTYEDLTMDFNETPDHINPLMLADHVILNTLDSEQYYNRVGITTPYSVIFNGVQSIKDTYNPVVKDRPFRFIFVGHSSPLKGFDQLLQVIEKVSQSHKIEVLWAGAAEEQLKQIIEEKKLPVKVLGVIHPELLNEAYRQVDAALIATACETCSYAAIEALAASLPIISTKAHGVTEIVENVGLLVDIDRAGHIDKEMYADAMIRVMTDEGLRQKMSDRAKKQFEKYRAEIMGQKLLDLYTSLV
jgi:glycosyltransferase involved in cell wall biosynthesis